MGTIYFTLRNRLNYFHLFHRNRPSVPNFSPSNWSMFLCCTSALVRRHSSPITVYCTLIGWNILSSGCGWTLSSTFDVTEGPLNSYYLRHKILSIKNANTQRFLQLGKRPAIKMFVPDIMKVHLEVLNWSQTEFLASPTGQTKYLLFVLLLPQYSVTNALWSVTAVKCPIKIEILKSWPFTRQQVFQIVFKNRDAEKTGHRRLELSCTITSTRLL